VKRGPVLLAVRAMKCVPSTIRVVARADGLVERPATYLYGPPRRSVHRFCRPFGQVFNPSGAICIPFGDAS
jgi:hypothetical protein